MDYQEVVYWLQQFLVMPGMAILDVPDVIYEHLRKEELIAVNGELTEEGLTYV